MMDPDKIFLQILNMSLVAGFVIIFVMAVRLLLKKMPKIFSYALWSVVLFRLVCPFSIESVFSLLPTKANPIPQSIMYEDVPEVDTGITVLDHAINKALPAPSSPYVSIDPLQLLLFLGRIIWLAGVMALLIYSVASLIKLRIRLKGSVHERDNIYICTALNSPFVMGLIRPKIYLPADLLEEEKQYIILHEQTHIRRFDHVIKIISFFVLCIHWFNPLVWAAFFLSGRDMEMSCDESVIKKLGNGIKKEYSSSLLTLATGRHIIAGMPLAFCEGDTKGRIKNVLNYKKPAFWVLAAALVLVAAVCVGFAVNPKTDSQTDKVQDSSLQNVPNRDTLEEADLARLNLQTKLHAKIQTVLREIEGGAESTVFIDEGTPEGENFVYITVTLEPSNSLTLKQQDAVTEQVLDTVPNIAADRIYIQNEYATTLILYNQEGEIINRNILSSPRVATELASLLLTGMDKTKDSVNEIPMDAKEYLKIELGEGSARIYYVYQLQNTYWVEKPYDYIRELDEKTYTEILNYLYRTQSQSTTSAMPVQQKNLTFQVKTDKMIEAIGETSIAAYRTGNADKSAAMAEYDGSDMAD